MAASRTAVAAPAGGRRRIVVMPFTYSIANGIGAGFISWVLLRTATGRVREIHPLMWVVAVAFVLYFAVTPLRVLFGL